MKTIDESREELKEALMATDLVHNITHTVESRRIRVEFFDNVPDITIECDYGCRYTCYGGLYSRMAKWQDVKSAIKSIRRKHKQHLDEKEREDNRLMRQIEREHAEEALRERATAKYGGRAKCILGRFGGNFSIRINLDEDQVMRFLEHNKDFIDENGHWTI